MKATPQQQKQLDNWVIKRDALLDRISILTVKEENLIKKNNELSESNTDIEGRISNNLVRLDELGKKEEERSGLILIKFSELEKKKTILQIEIPSLNKEIGFLVSRKILLEKTIGTLTTVHTKVFDKTSKLDQVVEHVIKVSRENIVIISDLMETVKDSTQEIVDKNEKNVKSTDIILEKLPRFLFELQKPIPIKKVGRVSKLFNNKNKE